VRVPDDEGVVCKPAVVEGVRDDHDFVTVYSVGAE
jgi:hypothetical protein